jgi:streptogramin lyase
VKALAVATLVVAIAGGGSTRKIDIRQWSFGLAAGGRSIWVGGLANGDVLRIDNETGIVRGRVAVGPRVFDLAAAPGAVWAVSNALDTVSRIDTRTGKTGNPIHVGAQPYGVAWGFGSVWVSTAGDGSVWRITNGRVVKRLHVGVEPNGITAYRGHVWAADHTAGTLVRVDPRTNHVTASLKLPGADWITGYGRSLYVSQETDRVARVDIATLHVVGTARVARNPLGSAIVGSRLWVPCIDANEIDVVDPATMKVVARKPAGPGPIVVLAAFGHVWVSHTSSNAVWRLDPSG